MNGDPIAEKFKGRERGEETIYQLAHRHLKDQNHTTTDEELRNALIVLSKLVSVNDTNVYRIEKFCNQ